MNIKYSIIAPSAIRRNIGWGYAGNLVGITLDGTI